MVGETGELVDFKEHGKYYLVKMRFDTHSFREYFIHDYVKGGREELKFDDHSMCFTIKSVNWITDDCSNTELWIQIPKTATNGKGVVLGKKKVPKKKRLGKLRRKEEEETDQVIVEDWYITIKSMVTSETFGPSSKESLKIKADEVKCSGCDTVLGFADDIMYPTGTTEGVCHWCEKKVTKDMTEPELELDHIFDSEKLKEEKKDMVEFAPPEPETNICPLCNDTIPDDTLRSPNFLCEKCKRPIACIGCKEEVLEAVGITECPWCHTDTESTEKIKHAIRVRREKKTYEEEFAERAKFMTDYATMSTSQIMPQHWQPTISPSTTESGPVSPNGKPWEPTYDEYPHRDDDDLMKAKKGWGVPFDIPKPDFLSGIKEPMKSAVLEREEYLKEEAQRGTGRSTQRRLSAMNHFFDRVSGKVHMGRNVLFIVDNQRMAKDTRSAMEDLYMHNYNMGSGVYETIFKKNLDIISIHEFSSRLPRGKHYTMVVLDLVAPLDRDRAKFIKMEISVYGCPIIGGESIVEMGDPEPEPGREAEGFNTFGDAYGKATTPKAKVIIGDQEIPVSNMKMTVENDIQPVYAVGERRAVGHSRGPTTVEGTFKGVVGLPANEKATYGAMTKAENIDNKDIIGYAIDAANKDGIVAVYNKRNDGIINVHLAKPGKKLFGPGDLVYADDVIPRDDPIMQQPISKVLRSRKEKPPRTALRCFKCGQIPDECTCKEETDWFGWILVGIPMVMFLILLISIINAMM